MAIALKDLEAALSNGSRQFTSASSVSSQGLVVLLLLQNARDQSSFNKPFSSFLRIVHLYDAVGSG